MAALSITAAQVLPVAGAQTVTGVAGATITAGQAVYLDDSAGKWKLAQCDGTAAEAGSAGYGIALTGGGDGQPIVVALPGSKVTLGAGAAPAAGVVYYVGGTAGALNVVGDLASTNKILPICIGIGSNQVKILGNAYDAGAVLA